MGSPRLTRLYQALSGEIHLSMVQSRYALGRDRIVAEHAGVLTALQRKEPDRVPYCELGVDRALAQRLMGWGEPKTQAATLEARVPFLHFFDGFRTSHEVSKIELVDEDTMRQMVDEELVIDTTQHAATVLQDELENTYSLVE